MSPIHSFDARRNLALPGTSEETLTFAVKHWIETGKKAIENHGAFFVALSGGSTPKKIFQELSSFRYSGALDWHSVFLFWSDERAVPPTSDESNYKMAMDAGLHTLPIPPEHICRMKAESAIDAHALEYEELIRKHLKGRPFDLIMLGMGDDGHTASLFPGTKGLDVVDRWVIPNFIPEKNAMRMTFTFPLINSAKNIALYVLGEEKSNRVANVLLDPNHTAPSARVGTPNHKALWILDKGASKALLESCPIPI